MIIEGFASTPTKDRVGDFIIPEAFLDLSSFLARPQLRLNHCRNACCDVGRVTELIIGDKGLWIRAQLFENGSFLADAIRANELNAFSVGFRKAQYFTEKKSGTRYVLGLVLREISIVSDPCNSEARFNIGTPVFPSTDIRKAGFRPKLYWADEWIEREAQKVLERIRQAKAFGNASSHLRKLQGLKTPTCKSRSMNELQAIAEKRRRELVLQRHKLIYAMTEAADISSRFRAG